MISHSITLRLQVAPADPFDPDGTQRYRVAAHCANFRADIPLTGEHDTYEDALGQLRRSILDSCTRAEMEMVDRDLRQTIGATRRVTEDALAEHTTSFKHKR